MVCSCALAPFSQRCTLHHSSPAFRLPYASERRSSLVEVVEVVAVVLCEVAVDDRPGHECKHSSGPAPLAFAASRSGEALDLLPPVGILRPIASGSAIWWAGRAGILLGRALLAAQSLQAEPNGSQLDEDVDVAASTLQAEVKQSGVVQARS